MEQRIRKAIPFRIEGMGEDGLDVPEPVALSELMRRAGRGALAVLLSAKVTAGGEYALGRLLLNSGSLARLGGRLDRKDGWARAHPAFAGAKCGGMMGGGGGFGLMRGLHRFRAGGFVVNMLNRLGNLGSDLANGRLLRNLRRYLGEGAGAPLADLGDGVEREFGKLVGR